MKLIAHRGLISGPDKEKENNPAQIDSVLSQGYDAEVDVWFLPQLGFLLGHDSPRYPVDNEWLAQDRLWLHAKNFDALYRLNHLNVFWHENDMYTLTKSGHIWTVSGKPSDKTVIVMPEWTYKLESVTQYSSYGVCSDYVENIRTFLQ